MSTRLYILVGPTGSGKTSLGIQLAQHLNAEIISVDSMAIYRQMDIGTAKPSLEERRLIPHHLIDICDPWESYSVGSFVEDASRLIQEIKSRGHKILLVGGTALYIKNLLDGIFESPPVDWDLRNQLREESLSQLYQKLQEIDPETASKVAMNDTRRVIRAMEVYLKTGQTISQWRKEHTGVTGDYSPLFIGLHWDRPLLYQRIEKRVDNMLQNGLLDETRDLMALPHPLSHTASQAIGYKESIAALQEPGLMEELAPTIKQNTRRFAKRQLTWLKRFPVNWIPVSFSTEEKTIFAEARKLISEKDG